MRIRTHDDFPCVVKPGNQRQHEGRGEGATLQQQQGRRRVELHPERAGNSYDLHDCIRFAPDTGTKVSEAGGQVKQHADDQDAKVSAEDQNSNPARDQPLVHQHKKKCAEQKFIGNRVKVLAEHGALVEQAGEQAVQAIADAGKNEERERRSEVPIKDGHDQERNDAQAQKCKLVGRSPEVFQHGSCLR